MLDRPFTFRWYWPWLIALYWVFCMGIGCARNPKADDPPRPLLGTFVIEYDGRVGRLILSAKYNGGTLLCVETITGTPACVQVREFRQWVNGQRYGD